MGGVKLIGRLDEALTVFAFNYDSATKPYVVMKETSWVKHQGKVRLVSHPLTPRNSARFPVCPLKTDRHVCHCTSDKTPDGGGCVVVCVRVCNNTNLLNQHKSNNDWLPTRSSALYSPSLFMELFIQWQC